MKKAVIILVCIFSLCLLSNIALAGDCDTVCNMNTSKFTIDNPYPGINVKLSDLSQWTPIENAMKNLGYKSTDSGEGGKTLEASIPISCPNDPCNFPKDGLNNLKSPININWVY